MKKKLSISLDKEVVDEIGKNISLGIFRNKSHFIEYALNKFLMQNGRH